ncbi:hypothetical protein [Pseudomonas sp. FME51]|uniref:hypothetical protein n=1 Tax=Pseudomonas sp. FME51 TaxID=2742609 RepID=UPI001868B958|nr:hypothetical protein [Pseudomonas sp. FME51]
MDLVRAPESPAVIAALEAWTQAKATRAASPRIHDSDGSHAPRGNRAVDASASELAACTAVETGTQSIPACIPTLERGDDRVEPGLGF